MEPSGAMTTPPPDTLTYGGPVYGVCVCGGGGCVCMCVMCELYAICDVREWMYVGECTDDQSVII